MIENNSIPRKKISDPKVVQRRKGSIGPINSTNFLGGEGDGMDGMVVAWGQRRDEEREGEEPTYLLPSLLIRGFHGLSTLVTKFSSIF